MGQHFCNEIALHNEHCYPWAHHLRCLLPPTSRSSRGLLGTTSSWGVYWPTWRAPDSALQSSSPKHSTQILSHFLSVALCWEPESFKRIKLEDVTQDVTRDSLPQHLARRRQSSNACRVNRSQSLRVQGVWLVSHRKLWHQSRVIWKDIPSRELQESAASTQKVTLVPSYWSVCWELEFFLPRRSFSSQHLAASLLWAEQLSWGGRFPHTVPWAADQIWCSSPTRQGKVTLFCELLQAARPACPSSPAPVLPIVFLSSDTHTGYNDNFCSLYKGGKWESAELCGENLRQGYDHLCTK